MISCPFLSRRRPALRAAIITLTVLTGCQGSLRSWRRDDPSIRDLVVTPHPWDEPAGRGEVPGRRDDRNNYAQYNRNSNSGAGRANPYASSHASDRPRFAPTDDVAEVGGDDEQTFEVEDAALKAIIADADPRHRAMLVLQYQAMKNGRRAAQESDAEDQLEAYEDEAEADEQAIAANQRSKLAENKSNAKRNSKKDSSAGAEIATAGYSVADDEKDRPVRQASGTRRASQDNLGNPGKRQADGEPVFMSLSDSSEEDRPQPQGSSRATSTKANSKVQEMKPPAKPQGGKRMVQEPVASTGYHEQFSDMPRAGGPREDSSTSLSRKQISSRQSQRDESADDVDANYTDQSYVAQASAESRQSQPNYDGNDSMNQPIIRPSARSSSRNSASSGERGANKLPEDHESGSTSQEEDWRETLQRTLRGLDQESVDSGASAQLHHHVTRRVLFVLLGQLDQALEPIPGLQPHEQEYFRHNFQALYNSIDPRGNPVLARRWPLVMEDHRSSMMHLGAVSNLEVKNAAFCSHVDGFGAITKFPTTQFRPNQELLLYCEVENFVSEQIKDGYETKLRGNYEIVDANQTRVADFILPEEVDMCKRPRRDYFFVYRIYTPQHIAPGRYQLRLTIEDMKGNKFGQTSLDMQIVAQ